MVVVVVLKGTLEVVCVVVVVVLKGVLEVVGLGVVVVVEAVVVGWVGWGGQGQVLRSGEVGPLTQPSQLQTTSSRHRTRDT